MALEFRKFAWNVGKVKTIVFVKKNGHWWMLLVALLLMAGCKSTAEVEKATSQVWHGGAAGSGGGKNYKVYVKKSADVELSVDRVWVGTREKGWLPEFRVVYEGLSNGLRNHLAPKGVTALSVEFAEVYPGQPNPRGTGQPGIVKPFDNPPSDLPASFEQGAVIYLHLGNNALVWSVSDFVALEVLNYP